MSRPPPANSPIRIVLADDHPILCHALQQLLARETDIDVIAEAHDGDAALTLARTLQPSVLILDVEMPRLDGLSVARTLLTDPSRPRIVFLTMHKTEEMFNAAVDAGALGYVLKESAHAEIVPCVRQVTLGQRYVSPAITDFVFHRNRRSQDLTRSRPGLAALTASERLILKLISQDRTTKEIADQLGISPHTVTNHRANICSKLGLRGTHSLLKFAFDQKSSL
ncbi:MAG: response regulator transcription factor [Verrucomicrobiae bacterium]|nr:response regulator transcription factor [Verrucomicrobiae bacterium]